LPIILARLAAIFGDAKRRHIVLWKIESQRYIYVNRKNYRRGSKNCRAADDVAEIRVWTTCPVSSHEREAAGDRTHELSITSPTPYYMISTQLLLLLLH